MTQSYCAICERMRENCLRNKYFNVCFKCFHDNIVDNIDWEGIRDMINAGLYPKIPFTAKFKHYPSMTIDQAVYEEWANIYYKGDDQ